VKITVQEMPKLLRLILWNEVKNVIVMAVNGLQALREVIKHNYNVLFVLMQSVCTNGP
jgi:hypothetical protein